MLSRHIAPAVRSVVMAAALGAGTAGCRSEPLPEDFQDRVDGMIRAVMDLDVAPGMAIAVVRGDETVFLEGYGYADLEAERPVTPETVFYIASSTKSFTGTAASILHERGELDLDASLASYLPELELADGLDPAAITLRDLLTHTHGIGNGGPVVIRTAYTGVHTPEQLVRLLERHPPAETGRTFQYGNIGYNVASLAMDRALGRSWKDVLREEIFEPLDMTSTTGYRSQVNDARLAQPYGLEPVGYQRHPYTKGDGNMHAAGGLMTTADDLSHWLIANLNGGRYGRRQALDAEAVRVAQTPHAEQNDRYMSFDRTGYGLGWNTGPYDGEPMIHHFGGYTGFHAHISLLPESGLGIAMVFNSDTGGRLADFLARYIYDVLREAPDVDATYAEELATFPAIVEEGRAGIRADRERRAARPQDLPHPLSAYTGTFESEDLGTLEMTLDGGALEARIGLLVSDVEVYDNTQNALRVELTGGGSVMFYEFDDEDEPASRIRYQGFVFERTDG